MAAPLVYSPYAYEIHEDPYPTYERLRDEAPAYYNPDLDFWALSRFEDVHAAMQDYERFSSSLGVSLEQGSGQRPPMIIAMDPPRQQKLRKLVSKAFTPRRVATMEPQIRALTRKYLDPLVPRGACDFIEDFSAKLPMDVISTMMGVPDGDQDMLRHWSDALLHREEGKADPTRAGMEGAGNLVRYFAEDLARRRKRPGDDLVSALIDAEVDGERLTDAEIIGFCFLMVIAGNETTTKMLGNAIVLLARHPDQRAYLVQHPERIPDAVEEVLRFDNSTQMLARVLTCDVPLHGRTMQAGKRVVLLVGSANRDERVFERASEFDIRRPPKPSLAFGYGIHVCLGASLARLEGRVALEEVLAHLPEYVVDEAGLVRVHSANVRGYANVPIRFASRKT
ncbi:MAG TPA: cytochrome P450 [Candidatus Eisenbacteria bacterium]|nr:cytochrome P450 [Candidatus Eisenbacteria bacterium]